MQAKNKNPLSKGGWKNKFWRRKTAEATYYQWLIQDTLAYYDKTLWGPEKMRIPQAFDLQGLALSMVFFIPPRDLRTVDHSKFKGRDVSNYVKLIEDAVFEYLGRTDDGSFPREKAKIEDSSSLEPLSFKRISWDANWHIHIYLSEEGWAHSQTAYCGGPIKSIYQLADFRSQEDDMDSLRLLVSL